MSFLPTLVAGAGADWREKGVHGAAGRSLALGPEADANLWSNRHFRSYTSTGRVWRTALCFYSAIACRACSVVS